MKLLCTLFLFICSIAVNGANANSFDWHSTSAPLFRVAGTESFGVISITSNFPVSHLRRIHMNGAVIQSMDLVKGVNNETRPPTGTPIYEGGRFGGIFGSPAIGSIFMGTKKIEGGVVFFGGWACTSHWICTYGVYKIGCKDEVCSGYTPVQKVREYANPVSTREAWIDLLTLSSDQKTLAWRRIERNKSDEGNLVTELWRKVENASPVRIAVNNAGGVSLAGSLEIFPGVNGQITIVAPPGNDTLNGKAALYSTAYGWRALAP
ncbi:MAG: hypothetical protein IPN70_04150 [Candidatus Moraniibacteriota bacterium]|nr:MAG: hypothetical protein IPN70_04150 [Candidatus Moranbacteria bacterium]